MNAIIETVADPEQRVELKSLGVIVAARVFSDEVIKQNLSQEIPMIRQSTIFSELLDQAENKGRSEGESKGEIKGRHFTLQKQLERKFGALAPDVKLSLQQLNSAQLEALTMAIFDLQSLDDFRTWLKDTRAGNMSASQPLASA